METNSKKMLEALPDFDKMLEQIESIKALSLEKMKVEAVIKITEAENFTKIMNEEPFFKGGKPVAVSYYTEAFKFPGIENNLVPLREQLSELTVRIDEEKAKYDVYKQMLDMFKTLVYQEKGMV